MAERDLLAVLEEASAAVRAALSALPDWGPAGTIAGQYHSDLAADAAAIAVLEGAGLGVLSEESGLHHPERALLAVLDPLDGSTNASRGVPWYATSICVLDGEGPFAALVVDQARGTSYRATRGGGATRDGAPIGPSGTERLGEAVVGLAGYPARYLGWRQFRAFGAAALDLCLVADGALDAYLDVSSAAHGPWDYLAGMLVCTEAGAVVGEREGRDLVVREHGPRRAPLAAATPALAAELRAAVAGPSGAR
ncbi:MAG TPA: inositol monophosphatase family protein [Acidimicrobiales bacterium]|nr:inositol monophosphatase family protein [Acidimicrobiales bacterium]